MSPYRTPADVRGDRKRPRYELLVGAALAFVVWWSVTSLIIQALTLGRHLAVSGLAALPPPAIPRLLVFAPTPPRPPAVPPPSDPACDLFSPLLLADMGPRTRDPLTLIDRAEALAAAGMRVMIVEPAEPVSVKRSLGFSLDPVRCGSRTLGLKVHARHSAAATKWGLLDGDVIVAVNGHPIDQPDHAIEAYATARREKVAVIEVARADARVVVVLALDEI